MPTEESDQFADVPNRPSATALYPWLLTALGAASDTVSGKFHPAWLVYAWADPVRRAGWRHRRKRR